MMEERRKEALVRLAKDSEYIHRMRLDGFGFWTEELQLLHCGLHFLELRIALRDGLIDRKAFRGFCSVAFGDNYARCR